MGEPLFHLAVRAEWEAARAGGNGYRRSTIDRSLADEGFIHCSFASQVQGVAERFYQGRRDLVLLVIDASLIPCPLKVEGGFPHIYGPLPIGAVVAAEPVPMGSDGAAQVAPLLERWAGGIDNPGRRFPGSPAG
ncbi:MAG TPA: DUF952 domain-containing protein [Acidimicrobiales bacterium]|nr:DUF952 domain-containing protein [Acidimicrobiales bacterium]